jgi:hypothetical protein
MGITEILCGGIPEDSVLSTIEPVEPWLVTLTGDFPSLAADAHRVDARMLPWVAFGHGFTGLLHRGLTTWPEDWCRIQRTAPQVWEGSGQSETFLFYPGRRAPTPSIRAERLRDGMEDYEYLVMLEQAIRSGETVDSDLERLGRRKMYGYDPSQETRDVYASMIQEGHIAMGHFLSAKMKASAP